MDMQEARALMKEASALYDRAQDLAHTAEQAAAEILQREYSDQGLVYMMVDREFPAWGWRIPVLSNGWERPVLVSRLDIQMLELALGHGHAERLRKMQADVVAFEKDFSEVRDRIWCDG